MANKIVGTISGKGTMKGSLSTVFAQDGKSAYELAVEKGWEGTEEAWLWSLKGAKGDTGKSGVYLGSGDMPEDCNVQIDLEGTPLNLNDYVTNAKYGKHLKEFSDLNDAVIVLSGNKADKSNVYTKTEADNLLSKKADKDNVYTKSEVNSQITAAKNEASSKVTNLQTSFQTALNAVGNVVSGKADKDTVYTKDETDNKISSIIVQEPGEDATKVMSQKALTEGLMMFSEAISGQIGELENEMRVGLDSKVDANSVYGKSEVYTKEETDSSINDAVGYMGMGFDERCSNIEAQIGDIDSALDELHNYAQALIGGNA